MSRTVPAVNDKYIVTVGPSGHVMCCVPDNGEFLWGMDLVKDFGSEIPFWYTGQCPIIDDSVVVLAPAGTSLLVGVNCANGEIIWQTPNEDGWKMSHSSIMPMQYGGKKMYIYAAIGSTFFAAIVMTLPIRASRKAGRTVSCERLGKSGYGWEQATTSWNLSCSSQKTCTRKLSTACAERLTMRTTFHG